MTRNTPSFMRDVYIVDGARTPFLKYRNKPGPFSASDLAVYAGRELLARQPFKPEELDEVIMGCVMQSPDEVNIARVISLRLGCGKTVPAWTVQRNCASGMQAIESAVKDICSGRSELVLAGGTEAMSRAPIIYSNEMTSFFSDMYAAKSFKDRFKALSKFRPYFLKPVISLLRGLTDHTVNLSMGQTAENLAYQFNITRHEMDEYSLRSHQRTIEGQQEDYFPEIETIFSQAGSYYSLDDGARQDSTLEKLASLKPVFEKFGNVTAGNSSQVSDGAALLILASQKAIERYQLPVLAKIVDCEWAGVDPTEMGLGPVYATHQLLKRLNLSMQDIDYWEINEAFAAQVIACLKAWESDEYCRKNLGTSKALGTIDPSRLNIDGGAIAIGHPVGASGARIVFHLAEVLQRKSAKQGIATICIGGGQGGAMLIERVSEVSHE